MAYGCGGNWFRACEGVHVVDLRDGALRIPPTDHRYAWWPSDVELKDNGSVAWIVLQEGQQTPQVDQAGALILPANDYSTPAPVSSPTR